MKSNEIATINNFLTDALRFKKGSRKGGGQYYHKVFLLLSFADVIANNLNNENRIYIDDTLESFYRGYWMKYERQIPYSPQRIVLPLIKLQNDGIWDIQNSRLNENMGFDKVKNIVDNGVLDKKWEEFFKNPKYRSAFKENLINYFFRYDLESYHIVDVDNDPNLHRIAQKVLKKEQPDPKEIFLRSVAFREKIKEIYGYACCVSNTQIKARNFSLIEAAHIVDFSVAHNDSVDNGIALNPFFHKAFDAGYFTIEKDAQEDFQVVVSQNFEENQKTNLRLKDFHKSKINLPHASDYYPNSEFLKWHQENQFERFLNEI